MKTNQELSSAINRFNNLDDKIRKSLYPRLYELYDARKINNGDLPKGKSAQDALYISSFEVADGKIMVAVDIHWGGDVYDHGIWVTI